MRKAKQMEDEGEGAMSLKLRRHYKLIVLLVLVSAVLTVRFGDRRIIAYTVDDSSLWTGGTPPKVAQAGTASRSRTMMPTNPHWATEAA
jgi:hypothetical protein